LALAPPWPYGEIAEGRNDQGIVLAKRVGLEMEREMG
jgi:hypothetical protein